MQVNIKRIDTSLPLPEYHTVGAAAFDFYSRETLTIAPHALALIPSNFIIATPAGYMLTVTLRSSTPRKKGLLIPHGFGIIDQDYCGPNDEIKIQVYNYTHEAVTIERGERIAQGSFIHIDRAEWTENETTQSSDRGGFGSTGS